MDEVDLSDPSLPLQELSLALLQTPPQQGIIVVVIVCVVGGVITLNNII